MRSQKCDLINLKFKCDPDMAAQTFFDNGSQGGDGHLAGVIFCFGYPGFCYIAFIGQLLLGHILR